VQSAEEDLLSILKDAGVDFLATLPCDRVKNLIALSDSMFQRLPLTREEEGVGICAGAALGGRRPAMIIQNSGFGNMVNALLSPTQFYELPLALFISHRGIYKEGIAAQVPMGRAMEGLLKGAGIDYDEVNTREDFHSIREALPRIFNEGRIHAFLLSPALWEGSSATFAAAPASCVCHVAPSCPQSSPAASTLTRYGVIRALKPLLRNQVVICNLGVPAKELHELLPQPSNFYMLGSMGMVTPIGLGVALTTRKRVFVIDGDGSLLMNPGTLATVSLAAPENLTLLAIDNASYGSTGNQPTCTRTCVDLELLARGLGFAHTAKVSTPEDILAACTEQPKGPLFVHIPAMPGNSGASNIPTDRLETKRRFQTFLSANS